MSLERPDQPNVYIPAPPPNNNSKHSADITKIKWNTQVIHIVASAAANGITYIWDLRQKKAWCELRDPTGGNVSDVAWNPDQGLHLMASSSEDRNPNIKLFDLRASTTIPLATLQGHTEGVLSLSWNPHDPSYILSCAKDNRTILWDLYNLSPVYDLPTHTTTSAASKDVGGNTVVATTADPFSSYTPTTTTNTMSNSTTTNNIMFGNIASTLGNRRQYIQWSPQLKSILTTTTFDRKIQFYSLSGVITNATSAGTKPENSGGPKPKNTPFRAFKWLKRPNSVCFGFGGKLVYINNTTSDSTTNNTNSNKRLINITQIITDITLINNCQQFNNLLYNTNTTGLVNYREYCHMKLNDITTIPNNADKDIWELMYVICNNSNGKSAREELLKYLG